MTKDFDDFGFSFEDEKQDKTQEYQRRVVEKDRAFREYHEVVTKFLQKLSSKPEKTMIKWPNRSEEVAALITNLNVIYSKKNEVDLQDE